jgi:phosphocarrier protein HPr
MSDPAEADGNSHTAAPVVREVEIVNKKGLHARASAKFVQTAEKFEGTEITVTRVHDSGTHETVGGTSIMGLMMLAAAPGVTITIAASGPDAAAAVDALCALVASRFGEDD